MKKLFLILGLVFWGTIFSQQAVLPQQPDELHGLVKWLSFKEAFDLNKKQPKPFLVDFYTDWCGWCKVMMKTTYSTPDIANYINQWFYPVKFNAETKDSVEYLGKWYYNKGQGKSTHELAIKLLGGKLSYPSTLFLNNNFQFSLSSAGYLKVKDIEPILIYTLENIFRSTAYEEFGSYFSKTFYDTTKPKEVVKWHSMKETLALQKKKPKKLLVSVYTNWCNGCRVMNKTSFDDSINAEYINNNFYLVDFNAEIKDTIQFKETTYINNGANGTPFHPLVMALMNNNFALPTLVVLDEELRSLDVMSYYLSPIALEPALRFYGNNSYKTLKWSDFIKTYKEKKSEKKTPNVQK